MFAMLDAEFAMILYDGETGAFLRPVIPSASARCITAYDDKGAIVFASEPKNLLSLCAQIVPFPPGPLLCGRRNFTVIGIWRRCLQFAR